MSKPILAGVAVVALAAGVGGYALTAGAPAAPRGGCPALVSVAPYAANFVAYGDLATLRNSSLAHQLSSGSSVGSNSPLPRSTRNLFAPPISTWSAISTTSCSKARSNPPPGV